MISNILLIFTLVLVVAGLIFGFLRGAIKQGIRIVLWGVLFAVSLLVIPQITDSVFGVVAQKFNFEADSIEQLIELYLNKVELLKDETALILPLAGLARSLVVPVVTIVLFWITGLISFILYLIVSLFVKKATENQKLPLKAAGAVLGVVIALFAGAVTVYPVAAVTAAVTEGDYDLTLQKEFDTDSLVKSSYNGSAVSKLYRYTGTEAIAKALHNAAISGVVEKENNIWTEFPALVRLGNEGWKLYGAVSDESLEAVSMQERVSGVLEAFFSLNFISDENKLHLFKNMKAALNDSLGDSMASEFLGWLEIQNKTQFVNDMSVVAEVYDILVQEQLLDTLMEATTVPAIETETIDALIDTLYGLSNANVVVPQAMNLLYTTIITAVELPEELSGIDLPLLATDIEWTEETKEDLNEVVSLVAKIPEVIENKDSITEKEKEKLLEDFKSLENNTVINQDVLNDIINSIDEINIEDIDINDLNIDGLE